VGNDGPSFNNLFRVKGRSPFKTWLREIINAILYLIHTGCQWRELPHDFPLWNSVYYHFSKYKKNQTWGTYIEKYIAAAEESGKNPEPSAAIIDSQSVKASQMVKTKGFDGNKKVKGKKYHIVVDTIGFPLAVKVHDANLSDVKQAFAIMNTLFLSFATIKTIWADAAYRGELSTYLLPLFCVRWKSPLRLRQKVFRLAKNGVSKYCPLIDFF